MYEFPGVGTLWADVHAASNQVPWIIVNPASGPGTSVSPFYTTALDNKPSNQRAIGYVHSNYNTRPIAEVLSDIDDWYVMYPQISGIFMDLLQNGGATADVCYGATVHNFVKSKHPNDLVVMNPGANVEAVYEPYSDIFGNAEGTDVTYASWAPYTDGFENNSDYSDRFWHILHTTDASDLAATLALTRTNNAGWVLITDRTMPNPYTAVPTYWSTFLSGVDDLPQTAIPNRGLTALPSGCLDLSLATTNTTTAQTKQTTTQLTNTVTNLDSMRFSPGSTKLTYSVPAGATLSGLSGSGWTCSTSTGECVNDSEIAASTALPDVTATVLVSCSYTSGSVGITLENFADNSAAAGSSLSKPGDCIDQAPSQAPITTNTTSSSVQQLTFETAQNQTTTTEEETVTTAAPQESLTSKQNTPQNKAQTNDDKPTNKSAFVPIIAGVGALALLGGIVWFAVRKR